MSGQTHSLASCFLADSLHLKHNGAGRYLGCKKFRTALAATHFYVLRLFGNWRMRENTYPNFTATFYIAGHCLPGSFNLPSADTHIPLGLKSILAKSNGVASGGNAFYHALSNLAVFCAARHQHTTTSGCGITYLVLRITPVASLLLGFAVIRSTLYVLRICFSFVNPNLYANYS